MDTDNTEIEIYISEIAERLYVGHASLMVGAGFSMNAKKGESTSKNFPSWNDLGDSFYKKLYGKSPTEKDKSYLDVLKLANEVEAAFGRPTLNKILRDEVPNLEYQPSELHEKLLQLPWVDVFTTNYDTLLERTAEKVLEQRYETVVNKEDLVWSTKPRIIKLHGSFPSDRPFIITEEDYRKYPKEFAPFVNTVQQSLLENTLCLIGFSSNDPNFQKWIGWIRDNLGKENSPKIFLIGKLSLSTGQKKLLEERNIIPVDLSSFSNDYYKALLIFVEKLNSKGNKTENNFDFPNEKSKFHLNTNKDIQPQFEKIISVWKSTRKSYPNWLILPDTNREILSINTEYSFIYNIDKIDSKVVALEFLYEFNWRIERFLFPIENDWIQYYENIVIQFNPYPNILQTDSSILPKENDNLDWQTISKYWIELQLSMLRFYREENFADNWNKIAVRIENIKEEISPELLARYYYERCLYQLFMLDIQAVRIELGKWTVDTTLPYWEAKRAGLLAELGDIEDAENILEISLNEIRGRLRLSPVKDDYLLVSQEAYILLLLRYVKRSNNYTKHIYGSDKTEKYTERWNELIKYKCDPWGELKSFESYLKAETSNISRTEIKYGFEIGSTTRTHHFDRGSNYITKAYAFLRYIEEIGIPLKLPNITFGEDAAQKAISCISNYSPNWGFISLIRSGDSKNINDIFGRRPLAFLNQQKCDELANTYLNVLIKSVSEINKGDTYNNTIFAISLSTVIPEILSRLSVKCSFETKNKLLEFSKGIYLSDNRTRSKYKGVDKLVKYLVKSFTTLEQYKLIPEFLEFPLLPDSDFLNEYPDPFSFIANEEIEKVNNKTKIDIDTINKLISFLDKDNPKRKDAITRFIVLFQIGLLSKTAQEKFAKALWESVDNNGFPANTNYYYFAFLKFPYPKTIAPDELLRNYIQNSEIPIQSNEKGNSISITNGDYSLFHNIIGTTNKNIDYKWQTKEINKLIENIIDWWNADKHYLNDSMPRFGGSMADEFKARFKNMIKIFSNLIILYTTEISKENIINIKILLNELKRFGMEDLEAKASFIKIFPEEKNILYSEIIKRLYSINEIEILDAVNATSVLISQDEEDLKNILSSILDNIKCRSKVGLDRYIDAIYIVLKNNKKLITKDILSDLEIGLSYLLAEIAIEQDDSDEQVSEKILTQQKTSKLLVSLKKYYIEDLKIDLPQYILDWEKICLDINEFSEIRNIWLNDQTD